ncbi:porin family protein [Tenacibaculum jejuense]|nr:porin family protein [Tenacibaculum jejuense]
MKKVLIIVLTLVSYLNGYAQNDYEYGILGGFNNRNERVVANGISASAGEGGVFIGLFIDMKISEAISIQPEIQYVATFIENNTSNSIVIPIVGKYHFSDKFSIHVGPVLDIILDGTPLNEFGLGIAIGAGYDITDDLFITSRYSLGLTNRLNTDFATSGFSTQIDFFQVGLGYRF